MTEDYTEARDRLLKACGYTPILAADSFFSFRLEGNKGLSADQLYQRGQQLFRRMTAPGRVAEEVEFAIMRGWIGHVISKKARAALGARDVKNAAELIAALQDFLILDGERSEGQAVVFRKGWNSEASRERPSGGVTCYKCGRVGHKAADCWGVKKEVGVPKAGPPVSGGVSVKIVCYTCGEEGHKSPQCPRNLKASEKAKVKPIKRVWSSPSGCVQLAGVVNGHEAQVLFDSGADISIVPEEMVEPSLFSGGRVAVKPFGATTAMILPLAEVAFKIGELSWSETVAVAPMSEESENEVLCNLRLQSERGLQLVLMANGVEHREVSRVTTRAQTRQEREKGEDSVRKEPSADTLVPDGLDVGNVPGEEVELAAPELESLDAVEELFLENEEFEEDEDGEECYKLREDAKAGENLDVPPVRSVKDSRKHLIEETGRDPTLAVWRALADKREKGLVWEDGLMFKSVRTQVLDEEKVLVLPKMFRAKVLVLAHDKLGHMGARRVKALVKARFSWPGLGKDVVEYVRSCPECQRCAKAQARKAPLMERRVFSEPFEVMGVDIVGPFPKGRGGCTHLLTVVCMATRWPEAVPLRSITARAVATGLGEVFCRTGIPLQLVSDQGTQFVGKVVRGLCSNLNIDKVKTTPYHPEGNGTCERMHGTLGAMLTKAAIAGQDWVGQVPFALFALRAAPNRDTGFSPFELVFGRRVRTPLDILHQGWAEVEFSELDTEEWAEWLVEKLEVWHSVMKERGEVASHKRKMTFDKKSVTREFEVGEEVLCRIPGMIPKLRESWHGPYPIVGKLNRVDYEVDLGKGRTRVLHINNLKKHWVREAEIMRLVVVAEDFEEDEAIGVKLSGRCVSFKDEWMCELKGEFPDVFSEVPGRTGVCQLAIRTGESAPIALAPHRVPDRLKKEVKEEVEKLLDLGVVVVSTSPWASPIVPVPKKDGGLRLCIDYRQLNSVTQSDPYYMVCFDEILERVGQSACISKIDLRKGFYQIEVEEESRAKTAFITPYGKFEFIRMPFGLKNAPGIFQRFMDIVLRGCYGWAAPYIDDVVVFSGSGRDHVGHLTKVFEALRDHGLTLNEGKCLFGMEQLEYLGHLIGKGQVAVPEHRVSAMKEYRQPKSKRDMRAFLGSAGYYRRFVPGFAKMSCLLTPATSKPAPSVVCWDDGMLEAFHNLCVSLCNMCVLIVPSLEDCFCLNTDASGRGIGATLNVIREGVERPVAFFSKQLMGAQKFYTATELECLAIFKAIHKFSHFLWGRRFEVRTDHRALVALLKSKVLNRRLHGWVLKLMDYDFVIIYRPGAYNLDADGLSRQAWDNQEPVEEERAAEDGCRFSVGGGCGDQPHCRALLSMGSRTALELVVFIVCDLVELLSVCHLCV